MVGFGQYQHGAQADPGLGPISGPFSITSTHDLCLAAYSRWGFSCMLHSRLGKSLTNAFAHAGIIGARHIPINHIKVCAGIWTAHSWKLFGQALLMEPRNHSSFSGEGVYLELFFYFRYHCSLYRCSTQDQLIKSTLLWLSTLLESIMAKTTSRGSSLRRSPNLWIAT